LDKVVKYKTLRIKGPVPLSVDTIRIEAGGIPSERILLTRKQILESSESNYIRINLSLADN